jgi:hypothetical protein
MKSLDSLSMIGMKRTLRITGCPVTGLVAICVLVEVVIFFGTTARAERAADYQTHPGPQSFGTPYAIWGSPLNPGYWEQYRKRDFVTGPWGDGLPESITGTVVNATRVQFSPLRQGSVGGLSAVIAPGLFVGPAGMTSIPTSERLALVSFDAAALGKFDLRVGFVEHFADGGGTGFDAGITANGGDDGNMDLFTGGWGVDGVDMHFEIQAGGPTWNVPAPSRATIYGAGNVETEQLRNDYKLEPVISGSLFRSTSEPLYINQDLTSSGGNIIFKVGFGDESATNLLYTWTFAANRDLSEGGASDDAPLQNGAFDSVNVVPVVFTGWAAWLDPVNTASVTLGLHGASEINTWRAFYYPGSTAASGPGANLAIAPNGLLNLLNFAFGLDPTGPAPGSVAVNGVHISATGEPLFTLQPGSETRLMMARRTDHVSAGLLLTTQFSTDLVDWDSIAAPSAVIATGVGANGVPIEAIEVPLDDALVPGDPKTVYFRFAVELVNP